MTKNVGTSDRILRAFGGVAMLIGAWMVPWPLALRATTFGVIGGYMIFTALAGTCFGYRLIGKSTCPLELPQ